MGLLDTMEFHTTQPLPSAKRDSWLRGTIRSLGARIKTKFMLGRAQYGSDIGEQTTEYLLNQMEEEAIDQLMYVREMKRRLIKPSVQQSQLDIPTSL